MDSAEIDRWNSCHCLALAGSCIAHATLMAPPAAAAQNQQPEDIVVTSGDLGFPPDGSGIGAGAVQIDSRYLTSNRVLVLEEDPTQCLSCELNKDVGTLYPVPGSFVHARAAVEF